MAVCKGDRVRSSFQCLLSSHMFSWKDEGVAGNGYWQTFSSLCHVYILQTVAIASGKIIHCLIVLSNLKYKDIFKSNLWYWSNHCHPKNISEAYALLINILLTLSFQNTDLAGYIKNMKGSKKVTIKQATVFGRKLGQETESNLKGMQGPVFAVVILFAVIRESNNVSVSVEW